MKFVLYIVLSALVFAGCQDVKYPEAPENLLPKDKFAQILADAYVANASRSRSVNNRILRNKGIQLDSLLYTKHQVDSLSFAQSNAYYASNLDVYTGIIKEVEKILTEKKARIDSLSAPGNGKVNQKRDSTAHSSFQKPEGQLADPVQDDEEE
tara:strand:- start:64 stop:522 length:459 start_codon:yes stop_codon:yes gene_type:complete